MGEPLIFLRQLFDDFWTPNAIGKPYPLRVR